ncbi:hypothetical protein ACQJBY_046781 [Aegilops geniculata]
MEEGGFQFQPGISVRFMASPKSPDIDWDGLDQVPLPGDIPWPQVGIDASSSPSFFAASSSIFLSDATNTCSSQPGTGVSHTMPSKGAMVGLDSDLLGQLLPGHNPWPELATNDSISSSSFASPSTVPLDATTKWGTPTGTNGTCLIQPSCIPVSRTTLSQGAAVHLDHLLEQLLSDDDPWHHVATIASSSTNFFASPSTFASDATTNWGTTPASSANTCLIQPSIGVPCTTSSEGAVVDLDLLEQLVSADNAVNDSSSHCYFASPSTLRSSDAETTAASASPSSANTIWIQAGSSSVRGRFEQALSYIREMQRDSSVLVQVWVPVKSCDGQLVLTTSGQPFTLDQTSERLVQFRDVSTRYQFSADVASESSPVGLPARVFIGMLPEWSPDVRYFTSYEYPMVNHAQYLDVHGTMGLPVFEKGNYSCLGVIELIMTRQKLNFTYEINNICSALQAVNLRSTEVSSIPRTKFSSASYKDALPEILEVLRAACVTHNLPLAQTWITCAQQGKRASRHSDENYQHCISTIDAACYVNDPQMQNFHDSCSDHHLLLKQGVAGKAFTTNQPCFLPDIGSSAKQDYPLSHHAKIFSLKGAVAIRLRCARTGTADFVLEFFLPTDCEVENEQKTVMDSLWVTVQSLSKTLHMVTNKEMQDDATWEMNEINSLGLQKNKKVKKRKPMARRSPVWKSFTEVMVGDIVKAKCNHCGLELCCDSKKGTSSLISHLKRCKLNPNNRITGPL